MATKLNPHTCSQISSFIFVKLYICKNSPFLPENQIEDKAKNGEYDSQTSQECVEAKQSRVDEHLLNFLRDTLCNIEERQIIQCITHIVMTIILSRQLQ